MDDRAADSDQRKKSQPRSRRERRGRRRISRNFVGWNWMPSAARSRLLPPDERLQSLRSAGESRSTRAVRGDQPGKVRGWHSSQSGVLLAQTDLARLLQIVADLEREISDQRSALNVLMNRPARSPLSHRLRSVSDRCACRRKQFGPSHSHAGRKSSARSMLSRPTSATTAGKAAMDSRSGIPCRSPAV